MYTLEINICYHPLKEDIADVDSRVLIFVLFYEFRCGVDRELKGSIVWYFKLR